MGTRKYIGGFIGLLFLSIAVYFIIFFFVPEVSMKFFGIAFSQDQVIEGAIEALPVSDAIKEELSGNIPQLIAAAGDNAGRLWTLITSEEGLEKIQSAVSYAADGTISVADAFISEVQGVE